MKGSLKIEKGQPERPLFVYDGDCGFCQIWVNYSEKVTGTAVAYRPLQEVASGFPAISRKSFMKAVKLIFPDGTYLSGAKATFRALAFNEKRKLPWKLYQYLPGFALLAEAGYVFTSTHRDLAFALFGRTLMERAK
jgi:predicted DCC family thiol-disulfide oxidoreductase YuxK